ncbi:hypothetical protein PIB30_089682 [Stylosanthes scabra]|uniref:Uncharacterized protein n=1 Tax=Stylosanthes scabra TaxID=79078 RepID=A0ABU6ZSX6_9FABA|nr:hypothetical protein [Stylosanthes scabra]
MEVLEGSPSPSPSPPPFTEVSIAATTTKPLFLVSSKSQASYVGVAEEEAVMRQKLHVIRGASTLYVVKFRQATSVLSIPNPIQVVMPQIHSPIKDLIEDYKI